MAEKERNLTEFMATARSRFKRCVDATSQNRVFQLDDLKFAAGSPDNGWQWPQDVLNARMKDPNGARPTLTINKLTQHIKLVTNEQRKNKPAGLVLPVDDKGDTEVAEVLNGIIRHVEVASHADVAYDTACESQVTVGEGYWRILTDYCDEMSFDQDIRIRAVKNYACVYMDPDGLKQDAVGRRCEYGFITEKFSLERYKAEFPKAKSQADWDNLQVGDDQFDWFDDDGVTVAEYYCVEKRDVKLILWADGSVTKDGEMPSVPMQPVDERTTQLREVKWYKINGIEILEESDWLGKYIPLVRIVGNEWDVEGQIVTSGIVRNAKDPQRMINYWASQDAELNALAPKAPFIGAVGQFENVEDRWRDANSVNFAYLEYNPIDVNGTALPPPQRQQPPQVAAGIINAKMQAGDDMQSVIGQYNPSLGAEAKEKSGRAIMARQQQADVGTFHYIDNLSRGIGYSTEIILDLIPKVYDTQRVARIIGEDGEPDHATVSVGMGQAVTEQEDETGAIQKIYDPSVGVYDVVVSVGPSFATKRMESQEFLTQAAQAAKDPVTSQILSYLALKTADWPEADEAAEMIKRTLPPQVLQDENADENDPEVQKAQLQQAAAALGQREAAVNAATEQVAIAAQEAEKQEESAKGQKAQAEGAMARAQAKVDEINAQQMELAAAQAELAALRREMQAGKRVAELEIENKRITQQAQIKEAVFTVERMLAKHEQAVRGEIDSTKGPTEGESTSPDTVNAILESTAATADAVRQMLATLAADRELITDDNGEPIGSRVVMSGG